MVAGIDGCRGGWVMVTVPADGVGTISVERVVCLKHVMALLDSGELCVAAIDIPIGLSKDGPRQCDVEARKMIGGRRSSVFTTPVRAVLGSKTYAEANSVSRSVSGKGMSRQAYALLPKIYEADLLMTPDRQVQVVESHPEVCFTILAGTPMAHHKATAEGRSERLAALRTVYPDVDAHAAKPMVRVAPEDILDAFVAAWSARRWLTKSHVQLGGETDERGLRMEMIA
ncbi:MAG TPA: DUF429 domain-containing protein [Acidimicrobiales bacterium]|nr:DUF429 domain-containing protein [Acidimicrobiales bacterium]